MNSRIDVHSHLLPCVDDGCKNLEESIECARMMVGAGYSHCFCTPHVWPGNAVESREFVRQRVQNLQEVMDTAQIPLKLFPGSELNLHPKVMQTPDERIVSMALAGKYILTDMWADKLPEWFAPTISWLQKMGLTVILAHPERMRAVQDHPEIADQFADMGILLQGNLQCFADRPDADTRRTAERYIEEKRYFMLGSDCHNVEGLRHRLTGLKNVIALAGNAIVDKLMCENPKVLLPS